MLFLNVHIRRDILSENNNFYSTYLNDKAQQILAINNGSSSLKITLFFYETGKLDRIFDAHFKKEDSKSILEINSKSIQDKIDLNKIVKDEDRLSVLLDQLKIEDFRFTQR